MTINAILLYLGVPEHDRRPFGKARLVAAYLRLHPLHVESVVWIAERKDVLSSLFFLLTLAAYVWYVRGRPAAGPEAEKENVQGGQGNRERDKSVRGWHLGLSP